MPILSGSQTEVLWNGLREAYDVDELRRLLRFALDKRLDNITLASNFDARVFDVIDNAERENWVLRLISAVCDARPDNAALRTVAAAVGLTAAPPSLKDARIAGSNLERVILDSPFYSRTADGEAMVAEKRASSSFGSRADVLLSQSFVEYLTPQRLSGATPGIHWRRIRVRYPLWYEMRPLVAWAKRARRPSRFDLWVAAKP